LFLVLCFSAVCFLLQPAVRTRSEGPPAVFELELPDFQISPSGQREVMIPSANVSQVFVHVLKPAAENIDYNAITTSINGQSSAVISDVVNGVRGKIVKINLKLRPGFAFVNGRNTVEVWAQNRRGRTYYSSFVVTTATRDWNPDFTYHVQPAPGATNKIPPQVLLLEPQRPIEFPAGLNTMTVRIEGLATSDNEIKRVSVDGKNLQLKPETATRQLTRITNSERSVSFATTSRIIANTTKIVIEAEDGSGSRTQVWVPVFTAKARPVIPIREKYALIVGISKYRNVGKGIPNLEYADVDARTVYEFLQQPAAGGFSRENMLLLLNENATLSRIRDALTSFVARASENDLLLIFFAGHGAPDPFAPQNLYVIAHDTNVEAMPQTALAMTELRRNIDQNVKSKRMILFLDACHSAGLSTEGTRNLANNLANLYLETWLYKEQGRAIITSSDVNEASRESQKWGKGHGVFTYYLLEGLRGRADANEDRFVSVGELFRYVRQKVRLDTEFQQNPRMLLGDNDSLTLAVARSR
jgi:caspase domain-containing protein